MPQLNPFMFREYDIRGIVEKDLTKETVELIGKALAAHALKQKIKEAVIGRDNRPSSDWVFDSLKEGMLSTGMNVIDLGLVPIPAFYYVLEKQKRNFGAMITGSHNPKEFNGFKVSLHNHCIFGKEIQKIRQLCEKGKFPKGKGKETRYERALQDYQEMILEKIQLNRNKKLKVVLDCGNGTASVIAPSLFKALGIELVELYCTSDGSFPNHVPDPVVPQHLQGLIEKVKQEKADLGIALDGDVDRIGVIDEKGGIIWGDMLMILFSRELLKKKPKQKILVEVKCSQAVIDDIKAHNGIPLLCATGHSLIEARMVKEKALLAGEMSGHFFFADEYFGYDDAMYAAGRLFRLLSNSPQSLSSLLSDAPKYFSSPEIRAECPDKEKKRIVAEIKKYFKQKYEVIEIDGARVLFKEGWGLVRASNTQPVLVLRFEGKTQKALEEIKSEFREKLKEFPELKADF